MTFKQPVDIKAIREELGLSQSEIASLIGVSIRTIQACEQGWRKPSASLERIVLLLLMATRQSDEVLELKCWEDQVCATESCDTCVVKRSRQGQLCWFLTGNNCQGRSLKDWREKRAICSDCKFFRKLFKIKQPISNSTRQGSDIP